MHVRDTFRPTARGTAKNSSAVQNALGNVVLVAAESIDTKLSIPKRRLPSRHRLSILGLNQRDLAIAATVAECRLITTSQLQRLYFTDYSTQEKALLACRRTLRRLTDQKILSRRKRRIGGVRRGSAMSVYSIGTTGSKLVSNSGSRLHPYTVDPSDYFFDHTLEIAELYTKLHEKANRGKLRLIEIQTEPDCWRPIATTGGKLCPDMYMRSLSFAGDEECSWFIEVDRGTTYTPALLRKLQQYLIYFAIGVEQKNNDGVFPQVLWIVPDNRRKVVLEKAISATHGVPDRLFVVKTVNDALPYICDPAI